MNTNETKQAKDLLDLRQHIEALSDCVGQYKWGCTARLKGCIEKCYRAIERMEQLHSSATTEANTKDDTDWFCERVFAEYNGKNHAELADKHQVDIADVYKAQHHYRTQQAEVIQQMVNAIAAGKAISQEDARQLLNDAEPQLHQYTLNQLRLKLSILDLCNSYGRSLSRNASKQPFTQACHQVALEHKFSPSADYHAALAAINTRSNGKRLTPKKAITQTAILDVDSLSPEQMRAIIRHFLQEQRLCRLLKAGGSAI